LSIQISKNHIYFNKITYFLMVHFLTCIKKRTSSEAAKKVQPFNRRYDAGLRLSCAAQIYREFKKTRGVYAL